ncbi:MAG: transposase [Simplicispira sp.]|nr:transposase [Simplicispira sp.]
MSTDAATADFFRARLDLQLICASRLLCWLPASPWQQIEASLAHLFSRKAHWSGHARSGLVWRAALPAARQSNAGRPRIPLRTMIALLYLKHAFDLSDEAVVERWSDSPNMQYFSGMAYFEPRLPCDATTLIKFRRLLGEEGLKNCSPRPSPQPSHSTSFLLQPWPLWWWTPLCRRRRLPPRTQTPGTARSKLVAAGRTLALSSNKPSPKKADCFVSKRDATRTPNSSSACAA